tara:strand:- start:778 stop:1623 length:846 start_codon:yes stop_codon:yes gene_type:complete
MNKLKFFFGKNTDSEYKKISQLLTKVFKKKFDLNYLQWLYRDNPHGKAITFNISKNRKIVGHYSVIPAKILINKKIYRAALSLNTAVDDNFRGRGFFNIMAKKTYDKCLKKKIRFIFGVSNSQSTKLFVKNFNFCNFGELNVMIGLGNINQNIIKKKFEVNWDRKSLNWRLLNPNTNYNFNYLKKNKITISRKLYKFFNINMGEFDNNYKFKFLKKNNFKLLNLYIGLGKDNSKNLLYFNLPNFLKPSPLNFILKDLFIKKHNFKIKKENIFFQLLDFDAY